MPLVTPTLSDQRYGTRTHQLFDYYRHSLAQPGDVDALLIMRHAGGGVGGDYTFYRNHANARLAAFMHWLLAAPTAVRFDVLSIESAQRDHFNSSGTQYVRRSRPVYMPEAPLDFQEACASVAHLSRELGFDPARMTAMGESYGAGVVGLSQVMPPRRGAGGSTTFLPAHLAGQDTHPSKLRGIVLHEGQYDVREVSPGVDAVHAANLAGWFGIRDDVDTELDAVPVDVKEASSLLCYAERRDVANMPPTFVIGQDIGDHQHPYGDPNVSGSNVHDSQQSIDLAAALLGAGVQTLLRIYQGTDLINANFPNAPPPGSTCEEIFLQVYGFLEQAVSA